MVSLSNHEAVLTDPPPGQFPELIPIPPNQRLFLLATPPLDLHLPFNGFRPGGKFLRKNKHYRPPFPRKRPWHSLLAFSKPSFQIPCSSRVIGAINTLSISLSMFNQFYPLGNAKTLYMVLKSWQSNFS